MNRSCKTLLPVALAACVTFSGGHLPVWAHQPVMDMAPRWKKGYGFQVREEFRSSDKLLDRDSEIDNPFGRDRRVSATWFEGIYTFRREVRLSFKWPWVDQSRRVIKDGAVVRQEGRGPGDLMLGLPLKYYQNWEGGTHNFGFAPSIRLPTGRTTGDFPPGDGSTDVGLSFSYSREAAHLYQFYDVFYWINNRGRKGIHEGDELGFDGNIGIHPYHNNAHNLGTFVMMEARVRHHQSGRDRGGLTGGTRLSLAPVLVFYWYGMMLRAEYHFPLYERRRGIQVSHGHEMNVGIGLTF